MDRKKSRGKSQKKPRGKSQGDKKKVKRQQQQKGKKTKPVVKVVYEQERKKDEPKYSADLFNKIIEKTLKTETLDVKKNVKIAIVDRSQICKDFLENLIVKRQVAFSNLNRDLDIFRDRKKIFQLLDKKNSVSFGKFLQECRNIYVSFDTMKNKKLFVDREFLQFITLQKTFKEDDVGEETVANSFFAKFFEKFRMTSNTMNYIQILAYIFHLNNKIPEIVKGNPIYRGDSDFFPSFSYQKMIMDDVVNFLFPQKSLSLIENNSNKNGLFYDVNQVIFWFISYPTFLLHDLRHDDNLSEENMFVSSKLKFTEVEYKFEKILAKNSTIISFENVILSDFSTRRNMMKYFSKSYEKFFKKISDQASDVKFDMRKVRVNQFPSHMFCYPIVSLFTLICNYRKDLSYKIFEYHESSLSKKSVDIDFSQYMVYIFFNFLWLLAREKNIIFFKEYIVEKRSYSSNIKNTLALKEISLFNNLFAILGDRDKNTSKFIFHARHKPLDDIKKDIIGLPSDFTIDVFEERFKTFLKGIVDLMKEVMNNEKEMEMKRIDSVIFNHVWRVINFLYGYDKFSKYQQSSNLKLYNMLCFCFESENTNDYPFWIENNLVDKTVDLSLYMLYDCSDIKKFYEKHFFDANGNFILQADNLIGDIETDSLIYFSKVISRYYLNQETNMLFGKFAVKKVGQIKNVSLDPKENQILFYQVDEFSEFLSLQTSTSNFLSVVENYNADYSKNKLQSVGEVFCKIVKYIDSDNYQKFLVVEIDNEKYEYEDLENKIYDEYYILIRKYNYDYESSPKVFVKKYVYICNFFVKNDNSNILEVKEDENLFVYIYLLFCFYKIQGIKYLNKSYICEDLFNPLKGDVNFIFSSKYVKMSEENWKFYISGSSGNIFEKIFMNFHTEIHSSLIDKKLNDIILFPDYFFNSDKLVKRNVKRSLPFGSEVFVERIVIENFFSNLFERIVEKNLKINILMLKE